LISRLSSPRSSRKNEELKSTIEELKSKNADFASELENLVASLQEIVEQNTALEGEVEKFAESNKKLEKQLIPAKEKNVELLDTVESLTTTLNLANTSNKKEIEKLRKQNEDMKTTMEKEVEDNAAKIVKMEEILEETTTQMKDQLSAQKESYEAEVTSLKASLAEANESIATKKDQNEKLRSDLNTLSQASEKVGETACTSMAQLEKDLEEEFQITTQLKRGMEELKKKVQKNEDGNDYEKEVEELLGSLRMIQCWQLSHFQRINKLEVENKKLARGAQLIEMGE